MTSAEVVDRLILRVLYSMSDLRHLAYIFTVVLGPVPGERPSEKMKKNWKLVKRKAFHKVISRKNAKMFSTLHIFGKPKTYSPLGNIS